MTALPSSTVVGVIGAGAMGGGIAQVAAAAGHKVLLQDTRPGAAAQAVESLRATFAKLAAKGRMSAEDAASAAERLSAVDALPDLAPAGLVVEAVIEDLAVKQTLLREMEGLVGPDCILATNTSSLSVTAIAAALARPGRLGGLHFFNPAPLMPLVEIVAGLATDPDIAATLFDTAAAWGKTPVHATSTPGFIVNRVARPYYAEGLRLLEEGAADIATIDTLCREAGGFRMGPFELMDLIGHDVNFAVTKSVWTAFFHDQRFTPSLTQQELVAAGFLGRKSGRGFYTYENGKAVTAPLPASDYPAPANIVLHGAGPLVEALAARLGAAGTTFERGAAADDRLATVDSAAIYLTDGCTATQRAAASGHAATAVIDLALDYATAPRLAFAVALQDDGTAARAAGGLLQAAGIAPVQLADSPALVLMRTVAMLANEAADAVQRGVCSAQAVDTAMRLGTNYPRGPLAWADIIGVAHLTQVLDNLAAFYGENRYRLSPYLRLCALTGKGCHD